MNFSSKIPSLNLGGLSLQGFSLAGIRTALTVPECRISFDVAQGFPYLLNQDIFFITHGHLDHSAGIPYIISQKMMNRHKPPTFYVPKPIEAILKEIISLWEKIEGFEYQYKIIGIDPHTTVPINQRYLIKSFSTIHRVPSLGYTLFESRKKLKPEFQNISKDSFANLKQKNIPIEDPLEIPLLTMSGDSQIEFLDSAPWIRDSKYLIIEATYLDENKSVEKAREWGHIHLNEIVSELDKIQSEKIILIHSSSRYSDRMISQILFEKIPEKHKERVVAFPGR